MYTVAVASAVSPLVVTPAAPVVVGVTVVAVASVGVAGVGHVADSVKHGALCVVSAPAHVVTAAGWVRVRTVDTVSSNNRASWSREVKQYF